MFEEDLSVFFDVDEHAVECVIDTTPGRTINVIFATPTEPVQMYEQSVEGNAPYLLCRTSDISGVNRTHTATIDGTEYGVARIAHEGTGTSRIYLKS